MTRFFLILLAIITLGACSNPTEKKVTEVKRETITIHDEVMPKMGLMTELSSQLKEQQKVLRADTSDSTDVIVLAYSEHIQKLEDAHEAMMQWMADYEPRFEVEHSADSALVYYEAQKELIKHVKVEMENSIKDAEELLELGK